MNRILPKTFVGFCLSMLFLAITATNSFAASLSFSPSSKNLSINGALSLNVILNTAGSATDGVDAIITFDNSKLQYVSATLGSLFENPQAITAPTSNKITLRATSLEGGSYNGTGTFATLQFKAISTGTALVSFDFTSGVATDSNVASKGADLLTSTSNGTYTIGSASGSTTSTTSLPETGSGAPTVILLLGGLLLLSSPLLVKKFS